MQYAKWIVWGHAGIALLHGLPHLLIPVEVAPLGWVYIMTVITIAPFVALKLIGGQSPKVGWGVLTLAMLGSLLFGLYNHFVAESPDHVGHVSDDWWGMVFQVSAWLLLVSEASGVIIGLWGYLNQESAYAARGTL